MKLRITILALSLFILTGCSSNGNWGWYVIDPTTKNGANNIWFLINGFGATILLSVLAAVMSMVIGMVVALPGMSSNRWISLPSRIYIEFVRAIPLLPMLFWVFYGLPVVLKSIGINISIDAFWGAIITLAISDSAFTAEIYRSGIQSINKGQTEAAKTVGLTYGQTMRYVILPQAIRRILPPLANQFITLIKDSAIISLISVQELTYKTVEVVSSTRLIFEAWITTAAFYFVLCFGLSMLFRKLEKS